MIPISVLILTKNEEVMIERCIKSVLWADEILVFQQKWRHLSTTLGIGLLRAKKLKEARPYFWRSLNQRLSLRTIIALMLSFISPKIAANF
jgi:hypothetical protein